MILSVFFFFPSFVRLGVIASTTFILIFEDRKLLVFAWRNEVMVFGKRHDSSEFHFQIDDKFNPIFYTRIYSILINKYEKIILNLFFKKDFV